jgi:cell division inhibitor SepF
MTMWSRAMNYLGLGPDDEYDEGEPETMVERVGARPSRSGPTPDNDGPGMVRPVARGGREMSNVREMPARDGRDARVADPDPPMVVPRSRQGSAVRTVAAPAAKLHTVTPRSFNDAQEVGDRFRDGQPVIVNLDGVERDLSRRIIDFTSGLCYALNGRMERVSSGVYLLSPASVEVSDEDRRRARNADD